MKLNFKIIIYIFLLPLLLFAQKSGNKKNYKTRYGFEVAHRPPVNYTVFVDYNDTTYKPIVYISFSIQYDVVLFEKQGDKYVGGLQLTASIMQNDIVVAKETWNEKIVLDSFKKTNSKDYKLYIYQFDNVVPTGKGEDYECVISVMDIVTRKAFIDKRAFKIKQFKKDNKIIPSTDLIFLVNKPTPEYRVPINPNDSILDYGKKYWVYFRLLENIEDSLKINIRIYKEHKDDLKLFKQMYRMAYGDSVIIEIPTLELPEGNYKISLSGEYKDRFFKTEKKFSIIWYEKPIFLYKDELALRPLAVLLSKKEMDRVSDLNDEQLHKWLQEYWKSKDPTPETDFNELKYIFYKRVDEANAKFSQKFKDGWETDRGRILLLYGKPEKIIDKRTVVGKPPYIIWEYNNGSEKFTFIDEDRDGEYILYEGNGGQTKQ